MTTEEKQQKLDAIAEEIKNCRTCKRDKVGVAVPGEGNPDAEVVFIGEAPGKQEADTGRPFIGRAGKILRELIKGAGLEEKDIFITSPVKYLPKHVTPIPEEVAHGRTHLFAQLNVIEPKVIVLLGRVAVFAVLQQSISVSQVHGTVVEKNGRRYFIAYHPAAMLHSPKTKELLEEDFRKLKEMLKSGRAIIASSLTNQRTMAKGNNAQKKNIKKPSKKKK